MQKFIMRKYEKIFVSIFHCQSAISSLAYINEILRNIFCHRLSEICPTQSSYTGGCKCSHQNIKALFSKAIRLHKLTFS